MRDIGKNIRSIRTDKNMTQDELAEKLFVTRQTVSNYETGRSRPDIDMLLKIAQTLDVDLQELIYEPVSAAERRRKRLWVAAVLLVTAVLGIALRLAVQYVSQLAFSYINQPGIIVGFLAVPGFYLLLGWAVAACTRVLLESRPLPARAIRRIRIAVGIYVGFYLFCQFPWMLSGLQFPRFWFDLSFWASQHAAIHQWLFLFSGGALGLCKNWKSKSNADEL